MKIIDGKTIAEKIKSEIAREVFLECQAGARRPNLAVILVGERPDSVLYVKLKEKEAKKVGIDTHVYKCSENISQQELLEIIEYLSNDDLIDAILVQLPLPVHLNADDVIGAIDQSKDADGFCARNLENLSQCSDDALPPFLASILSAITAEVLDLKNKNICLLVNSDFFGKYLSVVLKARGAEVSVVKADDNGDWRDATRDADIIVSAVGKNNLLKAGDIKKDAVIIDAGIARLGDGVYGDTDWMSIARKASAATPVPGGIGPLTVAFLLKNVVRLNQLRIKNEKLRYEYYN